MAGRVREIVDRDAVQGEFVLPGAAGPFNPHGLRGSPYQIGTDKRSRPLRICKGGAQAGQIIAQNEADWDAAHRTRAVCGVVEHAGTPARAASNDEGRPTLCDSIGELHVADRNSAVRSRAPAAGRTRPWN